MKASLFVMAATIALSGCTIATGNPQLAISSIVQTNCAQCQKDHYEYSGPYQFDLTKVKE